MSYRSSVVFHRLPHEVNGPTYGPWRDDHYQVGSVPPPLDETSTLGKSGLTDGCSSPEGHRPGSSYVRSFQNHLSGKIICGAAERQAQRVKEPHPTHGGRPQLRMMITDARNASAHRSRPKIKRGFVVCNCRAADVALLILAEIIGFASSGLLRC